MNEDEIMESCLLRVNEIIKAIRVLGEEIEYLIIVKKILRYLLERFSSKFFAIEEATNLNTFIMDELHGSLNTYEMRIGKGKSIDREVAFKA